MPHVLVAGRIHQAGVNVLNSAPGVTRDIVDEVSLASYAARAGSADAILLRTQPMTAAVIAAAPKLKIVSRHGVGYDAVDVAALNARGIPLAIVGDVNSRAVAEHTVMLMLAAARRTVAHDQASRHGDWAVRNRFESMELDGKRLLLVGFGRIGRRVAELARAFGMMVSVHDPMVPEAAMAGLGVQPAPDLDAALAIADYLSVHVPGQKQALIGAGRLTLMKPTAIVVNTARGGLIDETALDMALRDGKLGGAGLDVLVDEPPAADHPLLANPRVTISPHSAGLTDECAARMAIAAVRNILDFFDGKLDPALVVNAAAPRQPA